MSFRTTNLELPRAPRKAIDQRILSYFGIAFERQTKFNNKVTAGFPNSGSGFGGKSPKELNLCALCGEKEKFDAIALI